MNKFKISLLSIIALVMTCAALVMFAPSKARAQTFVSSSPKSDTAANRETGSQKPEVRSEKPDNFQQIINACAATAIDLEKTRIFADGLERENKLLGERLDTEKRTTGILTELNDTRRGETAALRETVAAKNETIEALDAVINGQEKLVGKLKNKSSPLGKLGGILTGVAVALILR